MSLKAIALALLALAALAQVPSLSRALAQWLRGRGAVVLIFCFCFVVRLASLPLRPPQANLAHSKMHSQAPQHTTEDDLLAKQAEVTAELNARLAAAAAAKTKSHLEMDSSVRSGVTAAELVELQARVTAKVQQRVAARNRQNRV